MEINERDMLRKVWHAFGCEQNPNDFRPEVRAQMWEMVVTMAEEATTRHNRVYRENQELGAELAALRRGPETHESEVER
jgi:hypothetical protein